MSLRLPVGLLALLLASVVGFVLATQFLEPTSHEPKTASRPTQGKEILAVFVVSTSCPASSLAALRETLVQIRTGLKKTAELAGATFVMVGVAVESDPWVGVDFVRTFGEFDEVLAGGSWMNTGILAYVARDLPGEWSIPQLVLVERDVSMGGPGQVPILSADRLIGRKIGVEEISAFANQLLSPKGN